MYKYKKQVNYKVLTVNTVMVLLILYFVFHALTGDRGVFAYFKLRKNLTQAEETLAQLRSERSRLEEDAKYLNPKTMNIDYLDEIARKNLGLIGQDEKVIYLEK